MKCIKCAAPPLTIRRSMIGSCLAAVLSPAAALASSGAGTEAAQTPNRHPDGPMSGPATPWRALMAPGWHAASYSRSVPAAEIRDLDDDDPRARVLLKQMRASGRTAPPATGMHGQRVLLIGMVKPVGEPVGDRVRQVLLMPYLDGCIHRPPAPANQVVLLQSSQGFAQDMLSFRLWVEGKLELKSSSLAEGSAAWRMRSPQVRVFDEKADRQWLVPYLSL
jgi:uncharacterized protein